MEEKIQNQMIVIFGATGDLTKRKLIPALYSLYKKGTIDANIPIICTSRRPINKNQYLDTLGLNEFIPDTNTETFSTFVKNIHYLSLDLKSKEGMADFFNALMSLDSEYNCGGNKVFYLATSPEMFDPVTKILNECKISENAGWKRVIYEKPFGSDLTSARKLNECIRPVFSEKEIYRIDHYLGKELVQNILVFRFANSLYNNLWNNRYIDNVQITISETVGVETRGQYYDKAGAIRDMLQNHMMQIVTLVGMEAPESISADGIRDAKVNLLKSLVPIQTEDVLLGQYDSGTIDGKGVAAYREELNVSPTSKTETFVALKILINNERWKGVPFYLRTGKRLKNRYSEVVLSLKDISCKLFCDECTDRNPNIIHIRIQPHEGIAVRFNAKLPGAEIKLHPVLMNYCQKCQFEHNTPEAYELLLEQILRGNQTLFTRWDEVEESWKFVEPLLEISNKNISMYKSGSEGPKEADMLLEKNGHKWIAYHEH